jgi:hypothetical protein
VGRVTIKRRNHGKNHSYWDDDKKLDGVTTLLGDALAKPGLVTWAARTVAEYVSDRLTEKDGHVQADHLLAALAEMNRASTYPKKWDGGFSRLTVAKILEGIPYAERDAAANRGNEIHRLAEKLAHDEEVDVPDEIAGHVEACVKFLNDYDPTVIVSEFVVVNRAVGYAGTGDAVMDLPTLGKRGLIDWKSGKNAYADTALQLAAYRHGECFLGDDGVEHPMSELGIEATYVVHLRADGYDVYPYVSDERVFNIFRHAAYLARWIRSDKNDNYRSRLDDFKGPALTPPGQRAVRAVS